MTNKINLEKALLTQGKPVRTAIYTSSGEPVCVVDGMGEIGNKKADEEVARRLVASWNACLGIPVSVLEDETQRIVQTAARMTAVLQRAAHVLAEIPEQSTQLLVLRADIVACIMQANPRYYGSAG